ncbi:MAG: lysophospholipid acyltransferase family protein [Clostridia bacterium]
MAESGKTIYYSDELNDDFSGSKIKPKVIDANYKYISKNPIYKFFSFIAYRIIATPIAFMFKWCNGIKYVNKQVLKQFKGKGYFVYANHTNMASDVLSPHTISFPIKTYMIVASENMNVPVIGNATKMLGAMPIPTTLDGMRNFVNAVEKRVVQGHPVIIYPEAHIWPYYTGIRPFKSTSFRYPVKFQDASFCYTTTYQQNGKKKKPKIVIYIDGPFYPNKELDMKEQQEDLRNRIYNCMLERSKNSNYQYYDYVKKG